MHGKTNAAFVTTFREIDKGVSPPTNLYFFNNNKLTVFETMM